MTENRLSDPWHGILERPADLAHLELIEVRVPQHRPFKSAIGERHERRALLVKWWRRDGAWGIGECSCRPDPFYSGEFVDGAWTVIERFLRPLLKESGTISEVATTVSRVRGWPFTAAAVLEALLDAERRAGRTDALDVMPIEPLGEVPVGISLGIFADAGEAVETVSEAATQGYHRVKMKISPGMPLETLAEVRRAHPDLHLAFDANGSFSEAQMHGLDAFARLAPEALEQPFAPDRLDLCVRLKERHPGLRLVLDESLTSFGALLTAERLGALDEVNLKPGRVGGQFETCRILDFCTSSGRSAWVGGMFETGVGRHANLRVAARLRNAQAHDLSPSRRYFSRDIVAHPLDMGPGGTIDMTDDSPVELDDDAIRDLTVRRLEV